ncbi:MAG TPA: DEAD/DEAH box helicase [Polyangia bacterium]|nr:DEAD/DEAH box helicase [Polyangia bacterium]
MHLVPTGPTLRVVLWLEAQQEPGIHRAQKALRRSWPHPPPLHPAACRTAPPWLSTLKRMPRLDVEVRLPRLGNGYPIPLPGPIAAWDLEGFKPQGRSVVEDSFTVPGWVVPPGWSLLPLRGLLVSWMEAHGAGFVAPQAERLVEFIDALRAFLKEGPLLPTLSLPTDAWQREVPEEPPERRLETFRLAWVPPVPLTEFFRLHESLSQAPRLFALPGPEVAWYDERRAQERFAERFPLRLARFVIEVLGAAAARSPGKKEEARVDEAVLLGALVRGEIAPLHAAHGSCLHPHHSLFHAPEVPAHHLHAAIQPPMASPEEAGEAGEAGAAGGEEVAPSPVSPPWSLELGLRDQEHWLPLSRLVAEGALRHPVLEHDGQAWFRPAALLHLDWKLAAQQVPRILARPELLAAGRTEIEAEEAMETLALGTVRGTGWELEEFLGEAAGRRSSRRRKPFTVFTAAPTDAHGVRLRVCWNLVGEPPEHVAGGSALLRYRFRPSLTMTIGDHEIAEAEAQALLAQSKANFLEHRGCVVPRIALLEALDLWRARQKVLARLDAAQGLPWSKVVEVDDEWCSEDVSALWESQFAAAWEQFLGRMREGAGVPQCTAPPGFGGTLRPYQERGLSWLRFLLDHGFGGCLADDMGLGKTIQVLALVWALVRSAREQAASGGAREAAGGTPHLVVCPTSVVINWAKEARRFTPELRVYVHQGPERVRDGARFRERVAMSDLVLTSYPLLRRDGELFAALPWDLVVADEAQNIKNPEALQTRALKELAAQRRLALTGTPVENRLRDLWSLFDFVLPGLLGGPTRFARCFLSPIGRNDAGALERLRRRIAPFLLRRSKRDPGIAEELPEKQEQDVYCELSREQVALYRAMVEATFGGLRDKRGMERKAHILGALTRLKQICNHPEHFAVETPERLWGRSGKLDRLRELLAELLDEEQATLVFTQFTEMGLLLQRALAERFALTVPFYHGGLDARQREAIVTEFQSPAGPPVLLVSLRAGGSGLNLTRASAVIHYDRWWNPAVEDQATDRAHRIGQKARVNVYKLVTRGTLEERVLEVIEQKRNLAAEVLAQSGESWLTEMDDAALREFLSLAVVDAGEPGEDAEFTDAADAEGGF